MKKLMESTVFKILQIIVAVALLVFGAFAPVSEKAALFAFVASLVISAISVVYDIVMGCRAKKLLTAEPFVLVASLGLLLAGQGLQGGVSLLIFVIYRYVQRLLVPEALNGKTMTLGMVPEEAVVFRDGKETVIPAEELEIGNIAIVKDGERIPADSRVFMGDATVDLSDFPGRFDEIETVRGDFVPAGGIVQGGTLQVEVVAATADSFISLCAGRVERCADSTGSMERLAVKVERMLTALFVAAAVLIGLVPPLGFGEDYLPWICAALTVLAGSSFGDGALNIRRTQRAVLQKLNKEGILPEDIKAFERASAVDRVMVEKTLGLGEGTYSVHHIRNIDCGKEEMLTFAAHLSCFSNLAEDRAIVDAFMQMARYEGLPASSALRKSLVTGFEAIEDKGLSAHIGGRFICTGTVDMMKLLNIGDVETEDGYKLVHVAYNQKYMGYIALSYEADQGAETVYNAWADAGITKYAVFGKDPEGIYEELSESKKSKNFIFAVERNTSQVNFGKDDVLTVKVSDEERFLMPEQGDFVLTSDELKTLAKIKAFASGCKKKSAGKAAALWIIRIAAFTAAAAAGLPLWAAVAAAGAFDILLNLKP